MPTSKPLTGIRVVEIGHSVAAPYAGMILGELGADVIKVESPGNGDYARSWGPPFHDGDAPHYLTLNRGKRGIAVDLADLVQRNRLRELILRDADAVICNLRPGVADRHGIGPAELLAMQPRLIYCDIGAFGNGGPMSDKPGYDPLMQAYGGLMSITGEDETRPPVRVGVSIIDMGAGLWAAIGILASVIERSRTGCGGRVETSLFETALAWNNIPIASVLVENRVLTPNGSGAAAIVPYQAFLARDGWLVIGAGNDGLFVKLANALDMPALGTDPRFRRNSDRVLNRSALLGVLEDVVGRFSVAELRQRLDADGLPNAPVQRIDQVIHDPQALALGMLQEGPAGALKTVGVPLRFGQVRPAYERAAPHLGEHTAEILAAAEVP